MSTVISAKRPRDDMAWDIPNTQKRTKNHMNTNVDFMDRNNLDMIILQNMQNTMKDYITEINKRLDRIESKLNELSSSVPNYLMNNECSYIS